MSVIRVFTSDDQMMIDNLIQAADDVLSEFQKIEDQVNPDLDEAMCALSLTVESLTIGRQ